MGMPTILPEKILPNGGRHFHMLVKATKCSMGNFVITAGLQAH